MYHDRTDLSKGIDVDKTSASKEYIIWPYWYFLDKKFIFKPLACNGCHDVLLMMSIDFNCFAVWKIHGVGYLCIINGIIKN